MVGPLNVAADYVDRISKGDNPPPITDTYSGDFNALKQNLNVLVEAMDRVTAVAREIAGGNLQVEVRAALRAGRADAGPGRPWPGS